MRWPEPVWLPCSTITPGTRALSTSAKFRIGALSASFETEMFSTALPTSTRRCSPVAVVTTSCSWTTLWVMTKSSVAVCPSRMRTDFFCS
jgi:hypothetical protein